jgi:serine protease
VNQFPAASFDPSTTDGIAPLAVDFDASASTDSDGLITAYSWNFGDGSPIAAGVAVAHTFTDPGTYSVRLTVTDDDGATSSVQRTIRARATQLTGTIRVLSTSAVDSDVNDRFSTATGNNSIGDAQPIPNPVRLGGFVNLPGTGEPTGGLFSSGDAADFFAIALAGNEVILLNIADTDADLDLRLWDDAQNLVDASLSDQATESIDVLAAGNYFIEVFPASAVTNTAGASSYVLSVGQDLSTAGRPPSRLSDDFVPGELMLAAPRSKGRAIPSNAYDLHPAGRAGGLFRMRLGARTGRLLRTRFGASLGDPPVLSHLAARRQAKYRTLLAAKQLRRDADIDSAEPNLLVQPTLEPNDGLYPLQWHLPEISLPGAWDLTTGTSTGPSDVIVAVVDTGILANHPDFAGQLVSGIGYDFISDPGRARDGNGIDDNPNDEGDFAYGASSSFHGTHVAGTVAARSDNGVGVAGVSWGAKLLTLRALGVDGGTTFDVIQAVRYAAGLSNDSGETPAQRADIIKLSLGSGFSSASEQLTYDEVRAAGVIVIASAGNESSSSPSYPAAYNGVVAVSATTIEGAIAPYSNFGSIDVAAPGGYNVTDLNGDGFVDGVVSTLGEDSNPGSVLLGYGALNGTSMAAPHVAGVAALMKALHPALTPEEFDTALAAGDLTDDLGAPGFDQFYGHGLINAQKAVLAATALASGGGSDPGPILGSSLSQVNLGVLAVAQTIVLSNLGTGAIEIDGVSASEPWLAISPVTADPITGLGEYELRVDRTALPEGSYNATAEFTPLDPGTNAVSISVTMQVAGTSPDADAGLFYVILVDDDGNTVGDVDMVEAVNGEYPFSLQDIPAGSYRLFAGSDMDDDNFLCDTAEACGAYRTLDAPEVIVVDPQTTPTITDLDFVSEFRAVTTNQMATTGMVPSITSEGIELPKPE